MSTLDVDIGQKTRPCLVFGVPCCPYRAVDSTAFGGPIVPRWFQSFLTLSGDRPSAPSAATVRRQASLQERDRTKRQTIHEGTLCFCPESPKRNPTVSRRIESDAKCSSEEQPKKQKRKEKESVKRRPLTGCFQQTLMAVGRKHVVRLSDFCFLKKTYFLCSSAGFFGRAAGCWQRPTTISD